MDLLAFIFVSLAIIAVPGPNVMVVVSTSLSSGRLRGLQTVVGTSAAMAIQLTIAAFGTSWFVSALAEGFAWLKWLGVAYLLYLGVRHLLSMRNHFSAPVSASGSFARGFWVSLTNPKTILFFSAFLPQFTIAAQPFLPQIVILSAIFWLLAFLLDAGYALLASKLAACLKDTAVTKYRDGIVGGLYVGAGTAMAVTRQT